MRNFKTPPHFLVLLLVLLFAAVLASCVPTHTNTPLPSTAALTSSPISLPNTLLPPTAALTPLPTLIPSPPLPQSDEIIFTIQNPEPWFGKEGDPRPNWLGWGAETFAIAPDGSIWIADSAADPNRLLHFNSRGELLQEMSLQDLVVYPYDLVTVPDAVWILDVSSESPKVVRLSTDGKLLSSVDIPKEFMTYAGQFTSNGVVSLLIGEKNELLLGGLFGRMYELLDASGKITARPLEALSYYGHTYKVGDHEVFIDAAPAPIDVSSDGASFLGFRPDGSFVLARDTLVEYYDPSGKLLGTARQRPQLFLKDFNHQLAFGPDGAVYQLVSNPDHSVQIIRLGFFAVLPPATALPVVSPTILTALQPVSQAATAEEYARNALLVFFTNLSLGRYEQADEYFGGTVNEYPRQAGETDAEYWQALCGHTLCLPVAEISAVEPVSADEFIFYTVFMQPDGTRFEFGACCGGDPAATPPVWQFAYPVQKIDGKWKVMRGPVITP